METLLDKVEFFVSIDNILIWEISQSLMLNEVIWTKRYYNYHHYLVDIFYEVIKIIFMSITLARSFIALIYFFLVT